MSELFQHHCVMVTQLSPTLTKVKEKKQQETNIEKLPGMSFGPILHLTPPICVYCQHGGSHGSCGCGQWQ